MAEHRLPAPPNPSCLLCGLTVFLKHYTRAPASMAVFGSHRAALCFIYRWLEGTEACLLGCGQGSHSPERG